MRLDLSLPSAFVLGVGDIPVPGLHLLAWSWDQAPKARTAPPPAYSRPDLPPRRRSRLIVRDAAINGFDSTGNRLAVVNRSRFPVNPAVAIRRETHDAAADFAACDRGRAIRQSSATSIGGAPPRALLCPSRRQEKSFVHEVSIPFSGIIFPGGTAFPRGPGRRRRVFFRRLSR
jgi:hypothetical protein